MIDKKALQEKSNKLPLAGLFISLPFLYIGLGASALSGRMGKTGSAPFPSADGRWFKAYGKTGVFKIWVKRASLNYG